MLILPAVMPDAPAKPKLEIRETTVAQLAAVGGRLFEEHADQMREEGLDVGELDPNWRMFEGLEAADMLISLGIWYGPLLVGYVIALLTPDVLHDGVVQAQHLALFLKPEHRASKAGRLLIESAELVAEARGASEFFWLAPKGGRLARVLEARDDADLICHQFVRKLCPQQQRPQQSQP